MSGKIQKQRRIDQERGDTSAGEIVSSVQNVAPPAVPQMPPPTDLTVVGNTLLRSAATPMALVSLSWRPPQGLPIESYEVQVATDINFSLNLQVSTAYEPSAALALPTSTLHYVRVRAVTAFALSAYSSTVNVTTTADTTPPPAPSTVAWNWDTGDLEITWVNPTTENFRDVEVRIWDSVSKTTFYRVMFSATGRAVWTAAQNRQDTSGTPDPAVYIELRSRSWGGVFSSPVTTPAVHPSKVAPTQPGSVVTNWDSDTGTAGADCVWTWTASAALGQVEYRLTIDGVAHVTQDTRFVYTVGQNRTEHSGTPDPVLTWSLVAIDPLDQVSTAASGTATNAAPAAPSTVTATGFFSTFAVSVNATAPADFAAYRYRIIQTSPSAADVIFDDPGALITRSISVNATYQVGVRVVDLFGQASSETLSSTVTLDALTLADLRAEIIYSDQLATAPATLKAALADDNRASGGVSYASNAGWVHWIRAERALLERYRTLTLSMAPASGTTNWYIRTSVDGVTWSYFSGPVTSSRILTAVANAAAAESAAVSAATLGNSSASRVDLPTITEARYIEVWLRNTAAATTVREFYPRRLVQSDDIEAESIRAINIAAASITADRMNVAQLSAITADMGSLTAGTITGALIRTASSGARIEQDSTNGLRSFNSGGTVQVQIRTSDGVLVAGAGEVALDANGIAINVATGFIVPDKNSLRFVHSTTTVAQLAAVRDALGTSNAVILSVPSESGRAGRASIQATSPAGTTASIQLLADSGGSLSSLDVVANSSTGDFIRANDPFRAAAGLNVGTATAAGAGEIRTEANVNASAISSIRNLNSGASAFTLLGIGNNTDVYDAGLLRNSSAASSYAGANSLSIYTLTSIPIGFVTGNVLRMTLSDGGMLGLGTTPNSAIRALIQGAGSTSATYALTVKNSGGNDIIYLRDDRVTWTFIDWVVGSDGRGKKNIVDLPDERRAKLHQVRVRSYVRDGFTKEEYGVVAQELQAVFPELVEEGADGQLGVRYTLLIPLLIAEVQALRRQIERGKP